MAAEYKKLPLFAIVDSLNFDKVDYLRDDKSDTPKEKDYIPFLVNRSMSNYIDSALYSNEMNLRYVLSSQMQHDYFINSLRKAKKYGVKWSKVLDNDNAMLIQEYYKVNKKRALEYLKILTDSDIEAIKDSMFKGGEGDVEATKSRRDSK